MLEIKFRSICARQVPSLLFSGSASPLQLLPFCFPHLEKLLEPRWLPACWSCTFPIFLRTCCPHLIVHPVGAALRSWGLWGPSMMPESLPLEPFRSMRFELHQGPLLVIHRQLEGQLLFRPVMFQRSLDTSTNAGVEGGITKCNDSDEKSVPAPSPLI